MFGEKVAQAFRNRYKELKAQGLLPDETFQELVIFIGGADRKELRYEAAVYAVLAYFFERCDIFEPTRDIAYDTADQTP